MIVAFFNTGCHRPSLASHSWEEVSQGLQLQYYMNVYLKSYLVHYILMVVYMCVLSA